jgi:uncharacterized protein (DUF2147 family)
MGFIKTKKRNTGKKKLSRLWITGLFIFFKTTTAHAQADPGDMILGDWMDPKKETVVHCFKEDGMYFGKLIWIENTERKCQPLSEPDKHLINYIVLRNFEYKDNEWVDGIILQPKTNKTYTAYLRLKDNDSMEVTGYIFFRFLSESQVFTRVTTADVEALNLQSVFE